MFILRNAAEVGNALAVIDGRGREGKIPAFTKDEGYGVELVL